MRQQLEKEKREMELKFEKARMEKKNAEEETHQKKLDEMREEMDGELKRKKELTCREVEQEGAEESSKNGKSSRRKSREMESLGTGVSDARGPYRKHSTPKATKKLTKNLLLRSKYKSIGGPSYLPESFQTGRVEDDTPFGHPEVPKKEDKSSKSVREIAKTKVLPITLVEKTLINRLKIRSVTQPPRVT
ncbi:uncharacterized protein LOC134206933 [Armigeres subalbatus]|uniref:uncharacterized protein LOC134206933 n=1 Tax=Armigeres subalbatus TaxID=124917 RepID=UPI002ED4AEDE